MILLLLSAACATFAAGGQVQSGRHALLLDDPESALPYFQAVAERNPNYVFQSMDFREGIWTYVGRAQYGTKRYTEARQSLERALAQDPNDHLARLYLGLSLARSGERASGFKQIEAAMKGIYDWLEYINRVRAFQAYWDPLRTMRNQIELDLATLSGRDSDPEPVLPNAEWLGKTLEEEIDRVRRDERRDLDRDFEERRRGLGIGIGIGF
jgi:tetratricopeptide (TPR) repeat protein